METLEKQLHTATESGDFTLSTIPGLIFYAMVSSTVPTEKAA
jgi:hypothetical protein